MKPKDTRDPLEIRKEIIEEKMVQDALNSYAVDYLTTRLAEAEQSLLFYADKKNWVLEQLHAEPSTHYKIKWDDVEDIWNGAFGGKLARNYFKKHGKEF